MKTKSVVDHKRRIDALFAKVGKGSFVEDDLELQGHWASYLCVLVSGFLEQSIRAIYNDYAIRTASPNSSKFIIQSLKNLQNPNMTRICQTAGRFSSTWEEELRNYCAEKIKADIDSIVTNRNQVAHGVIKDISYVRVKDYYQSAIAVIEFIEEQCLGKE